MVEELIDYLVKTEVFLPLTLRLDNSIGQKRRNEIVLKYKPSDEHRNKCPNDRCYNNSLILYLMD